MIPEENKNEFRALSKLHNVSKTLTLFTYIHIFVKSFNGKHPKSMFYYIPIKVPIYQIIGKIFYIFYI